MEETTTEIKENLFFIEIFCKVLQITMNDDDDDDVCVCTV